MSLELINYVHECLQTCIENTLDLNRFDYVISILERLIFSISLEASETNIEWAHNFIDDLENLINIIENISLSENNPSKINIPRSTLEELLEMRFTAVAIAKIYGVSRQTLYRRFAEYGLSVSQTYSEIADDELHNVLTEILIAHPYTGYKRMIGFLASRGVRVTERRVRESMRAVDPIGVAERTAINRTIYRRVYFVRYAMDRWHLDTNMKLTRRYKFIIRSCVDGNSRCCVFLQIGPDNKATSNLDSFMSGVREYGPPRGIRCDKGGENWLIARFMMSIRGIDNGSVLAGRSVHNQRIERFWVDVYRDTRFFYELFQEMEQNGILDIDNSVHLFALHFVFLPRIQRSFDEFRSGWNNHGVSTERNRTPNQLMILNRPPDERHCQYTPEALEEVYQFCLSTHNEMDAVYDPVRNPRPINHNLQDDIVERLIMVDCLRESESHGIDIFVECLYLLQN